jgi:hypothetical protein
MQDNIWFGVDQFCIRVECKWWMRSAIRQARWTKELTISKNCDWFKKRKIHVVQYQLTCIQVNESDWQIQTSHKQRSWTMWRIVMDSGEEKDDMIDSIHMNLEFVSNETNWNRVQIKRHAEQRIPPWQGIVTGSGIKDLIEIIGTPGDFPICYTLVLRI